MLTRVKILSKRTESEDFVDLKRYIEMNSSFYDCNTERDKSESPHDTSGKPPKAKKRRGPYLKFQDIPEAVVIGHSECEVQQEIKRSKQSQSDRCQVNALQSAVLSDHEGLDAVEIQTTPSHTHNVDIERPIIQINETLMEELHYEPLESEQTEEKLDGIEEIIQLLRDYADEEPVTITDQNATVQNSEEAIVDDDDEIVTKMPSLEEDQCNKKLFPGSTKRVGFVILLLCCLSIRFKLSDECLGFIISAFSICLPTGSQFIKSVYSLKNHLKNFVCFPKIHYLCSSCGTHVPKTVKTCTNKYCARDLTSQDAVGYFIQHSVIDQIQLMCKRSTFLNTIRTNRFKHYKNSDHQLKDVYDGYNYQKSFDSGFLKNPNSLSFSLNTDGVPIFKSSAVSMWPVYMIVNELPVTERKLKENIIYYGLWISNKKPVMWSYLKPLHEELSRLENGIEMKDSFGNAFMLTAMLLNCVCDLPARCMLSNSMQFNGKFGCWFCLQAGESYKTDKGGHVRVYPFQQADPKGPERNVQNLQSDVNEVVKNVQEKRKDYIVNGIKGPFWFMFLQNFNVIHGFVIDYMHGICSGVVKLLISLWFDKQFKDEKFSSFTKRDTVNARLLSVKPNIQITRPPRSLDELCHWKAAEFRNFLFLWSLPVLQDILKAEYYMHYNLLVQGIYILSKENISVEDLQNAEMCLLKFLELFSSLYSLRYLTMNLHQLLHIVESVKANGPLFVNNCFFFEDLNGYILKHVHGPTGVETQIINALTKMQAIPTLQELYTERGSSDEMFINTIMRPNYINDGYCLDDTGIFLLGQTYYKTLDETEFVSASKVGCVSPNVKEYRKIFVSKLCTAVYGSAYKRLNKRQLSCVKFLSPEGSVMLGTVRTFIQFENGASKIINVALLEEFLSDQPYSERKTMLKVKKKNKFFSSSEFAINFESVQHSSD